MSLHRCGARSSVLLREERCISIVVVAGVSVHIPSSLDDGSRLSIAPALAAAYLQSLEANGLLALANGARPDPAPVGGLSKEATDLHYAHAFDGSAARAQLALLDPKSEVETTSTTLLQYLTGGDLTFIDVPAGAGAAALSLLCSVAELRRVGTLPRTPLKVNLLWGEISEPARNYADELMGRVETTLADQAIFVDWSVFSWDVLSEVSNAALVEKIVISKASSEQTLLLISNFNGFLEKENKKKAAYPQLAELLKYSSGSLNAAVWIEPNMNTAKLKLFPFILDKLAKLAGFAKAALGGAGNESTEYLFAIPMKPTSTANVRLCVMPIELTKAVV